MLHAEARELLADVALEPGRLARLADDPSPEAGALRRHLAECGPCAADLAAWRRTWAHVGAALDELDMAGADLLEEGAGASNGAPDAARIPAALRARTLARVAAEGAVRAGQPGSLGAPASQDPSSSPDATASQPGVERSPGAGGRGAGSRQATHRRRWAPWAVMAAALVIALGAGSLAWTRTRDLDRAQVENSGLAATMASLDRVLATPAHWTVTLRTPDGVAGGTMAWSGSEIAVITTALPSPAEGASYRCWVERDGVRTPIGPMWLSGSTGYWAGPIGGWSALLTPGSRVGVSLIPAGDGPAAPVLVGTL